MMDMLKSMAIFSEVARLGSFRAAAKSQNLSPSVISRHISSLEDSLGEVLLSRSTRKLALTSIGEKFLVHCDRMLESANKGLTSVKENVDRGHLRLTLPITLTTTKFASVINAFRAANPQVDFSFTFDDNNIDIVDEGFDIALRLGPLEDSSLKAKRVATVRRSIFCTPNYLAASAELALLDDLNRCTWIGRKNPAVLPVVYSATNELITIPKQDHFIQVNSVAAVKAFVLAGNGVGLMSDMMFEEELETGKVLRLLPDWRVESMHLYAVWSAQRTTGQLVKKFVDFLSEQLVDL